MKTKKNNMVTISRFNLAIGGLKSEIGELRTDFSSLRLEFGELRSDMKRLEIRVFSAIKDIEERMYTKEDHAKFMVWMDEAMTELRDARDDRKVTGHQIARLDNTVFDHEKRIGVLEKKT
jgi:regulator of replication initiation timing